MEFKLTEEQSQDLLSHFGNYKDIIKLIHEEAYDILERYYQSYVKSHKGIFRPSKKDRFFDKITKRGSNLHTSITVVEGYKYVYSYNRAVLIPNKLNILKVSHEHISNQIVHAALETPYILGNHVNKVEQTYNILLEYGSVPYVVDKETIELYEKVKEQNLERIELLKVIGVDYDL